MSGVLVEVCAIMLQGVISAAFPGSKTGGGARRDKDGEILFKMRAIRGWTSSLLFFGHEPPPTLLTLKLVAPFLLCRVL